MTDLRDQITELFDAEIAQAERDHETSAFVSWLKALRDQVLALVPETRETR